VSLWRAPLVRGAGIEARTTPHQWNVPRSHKFCKERIGEADSMIALFTDFGLHGPYTGQMKAVLHQMAPGIPAIDLFADAPVGNPKASAYLLAVYAGWFQAGTVFLCV
jgi:hypothetical protein